MWQVENLKRPAVFERVSSGSIGHVGFFDEELLVTGSTDGSLHTFEFKKLG